LQLFLLFLRGKNQRFALEDLCDIEIEEVAVEDSLNTASHDRDGIVGSFVDVSVDPVDDVEGAVGSQSEQIVRRYRFSFPGFRHHEQLGKNRNRLQVDREGPKNLHDGKLVVENQSENGDGGQDEFDPETVVVTVVGRFELEIHQVDCGSCRSYEEAFHDGVVHADEVGEQIKISGDKHDQEKNLGFAGDSGATSRLPDLEEQDDDGEEMRNISEKPEDVHTEDEKRLASWKPPLS